MNNMNIATDCLHVGISERNWKKLTFKADRYEL